MVLSHFQVMKQFQSSFIKVIYSLSDVLQVHLALQINHRPLPARPKRLVL